MKPKHSHPWRAGCLVALALGACRSETEQPKPGPGLSSATANPSAAAAPTSFKAVAPEALAPPAPRPKHPQNVMLITIDSLRADMPWTGYPRPIAPNLTRLAEQSVVYTHAYSLSSYTAKSVAGFLTSHYPSTLYRSGTFFTNYPRSDTFIAEILTQHGIPSAGWHAHMYFRGAGLDQGFTAWELVPGIHFDPEADDSVTSDKMTKLGIKLLSRPSITGKQFFAWAHYMDPHHHYNRHPESPNYGNRNRDLYDGEVYYTDLWLGKLFDWARTQSWWKNTIVIISADHGEAFGEHGFYRHAFEIWECLIRVPLMFYGPNMRPRRIDERRSHIDLAPTILDLMGLPPQPEFMGKSLAPELYGAAPAYREPILSELTEDSHNPLRRAVLLGDYKLIAFQDEKFQLYNVTRDPGEEVDLAPTEPQRLEEMKRVYHELYAKLPVVEPYGGTQLKEGGIAHGPVGPPVHSNTSARSPTARASR